LIDVAANSRFLITQFEKKGFKGVVELVKQMKQGSILPAIVGMIVID